MGERRFGYWVAGSVVCVALAACSTDESHFTDDFDASGVDAGSGGAQSGSGGSVSPSGGRSSGGLPGKGGATSGGAPSNGGTPGNGGTGSGGEASGGTGSGGEVTGGTGPGGAGTGGATGGTPNTGGTATGGQGDGGVQVAGGAPGTGGDQGSGGSCGNCTSGACLSDGTCVECTDDDHCSGLKPACNLQRNICVPCTGDEHCTGQLPACNTATNRCVACNGDVDCTGPASHCRQAAHVCVECLPSADDCANGTFCAATFSCVPGCKASGAGCTSGECTDVHDCTACLYDSECAGGRLCGTGQCRAACQDSGDCDGGRACCDSRCVDTTRDQQNCGGCGAPCGNSSFCGTGGCTDNTVANVCDVQEAVFVLDGLGLDDALAAQVEAALSQACPSVKTELLPQNTVGLIQHDDSLPNVGKPVLGGGRALVILGGPFGQRTVRYIDQSGLSDVAYSSASGEALFTARGADGGSGTVIARAAAGDITPSHNFFVIETVVDPESGTLVFALYGFDASGTAAAAWFFEHVMLPDLNNQDRAYYVYEWTDGDGDEMPGTADTFTFLGSGP